MPWQDWSGDQVLRALERGIFEVFNFTGIYSVTVFLGDNFFALVQPGMLIRVTALSLQNQAPHRQTKNINTIFLCREFFINETESIYVTSFFWLTMEKVTFCTKS